MADSKRVGTLAAGIAVASAVTMSAIVMASPAAARDQIQIVGSSTVYPFLSAVAERFAQQTGQPSPVIESTGTGRGLRLLCRGIGADYPDVSGASRRIRAKELDACKANGIAKLVEIKIGFDGIVVANSNDHKPFAFNKDQLFKALAAQVPVSGAMAANPHKQWSDIDASLPAETINVIGPPSSSGTRDAFVELAMMGGAEAAAAASGLDVQMLRDAAENFRDDGDHYVEAGEDDLIIVRKLVASPNTLGIFGFSFLDQNFNTIQGSAINGVAPTFETIQSGDYPLSRSLYVYTKAAHVTQIGGMPGFLELLTAEDTIGEEGFLVDIGLIPLADGDRAASRSVATQLPGLELN